MSIWRRTAIWAATRLVFRSAYDEERFIRSIEFSSQDEKQAAADRRLKQMLRHAADKCPYYARVLHEADVVDGDTVKLENFDQIPFLTKDIIRREGDALYASDHEKRRSYTNTSGGSTGEPVTFLQDPDYWWRRTATRFLFNRWAGKKPGEREVMLWGSPRDLIAGGESLKKRLQSWLFNSRLLNSYRMSEADKEENVQRWNTYRPVLVWTLVESLEVLARYIQNHGKHIMPPCSIISTAGPLTEEVREFAQDVFGCPVYNQYGSREAGPIAAECAERDGLHVFENAVRVEVVRPDGTTAELGEHGEIVVTSLINRSMPLIRYKIGDTGTLAEGLCPCDRPLTRLANVTGRTRSHFRATDGALVHGGYFVRLFYGRPWVKKFQVRQTRTDRIDAFVVKAGEPSIEDIRDMQHKTRIAMGRTCELHFSFVDEIPPSPSGKFLYTICELPDHEAP